MADKNELFKEYSRLSTEIDNLIQLQSDIEQKIKKLPTTYQLGEKVTYEGIHWFITACDLVVDLDDRLNIQYSISRPSNHYLDATKSDLLNTKCLFRIDHDTLIRDWV